MFLALPWKRSVRQRWLQHFRSSCCDREIEAEYCVRAENRTQSRIQGLFIGALNCVEHRTMDIQEILKVLIRDDIASTVFGVVPPRKGPDRFQMRADLGTGNVLDMQKRSTHNSPKISPSFIL
jgi:hypothetical protein